MSHDSTPAYRPGLRGWWAFFWRYSPIGSDKSDWLRDLSRRWRPSARLRQCEAERAYYQRLAEANNRIITAILGEP